jgi:GMP synthase-like glutamine amidotransferase
LRLGILKTGRPPRPAIPEWGTYPEMFVRLLGPEAYDYVTYAVDEGELPPTPDTCDAYLITGSSAGVYDPHPWIGELIGFLRAAKGRAKLVGVCFGHQAMAEAFGGRVEKSDKGWGIGEQDYRVTADAPWTDGAATVRLPASHQDQVTVPPPGADVLLANSFAPFAGFVWRDQPAISMQPHPEFEAGFAIGLIQARRGKDYPPRLADAAIESHKRPDDRAKVGAWIRGFLDG